MDTLLFKDIGLKPSTAKAAATRAVRDGMTAAEYLRALVERDVNAAKTLDDVVRPFRDAFARGGKSEEELDVLVKAARRQIAKRGPRKGPK
jgi:hypothetical protein